MAGSESALLIILLELRLGRLSTLLLSLLIGVALLNILAETLFYIFAGVVTAAKRGVELLAGD